MNSCIRSVISRVVFTGLLLISASSASAQILESGERIVATLNTGDVAAAAARNAAAQGTAQGPLGALRAQGDTLRVGGFLVGSYSYNSRIQMVPEFAGGAQALTPAGETNFRFDKFGIGVFKAFNPWLSAHGAIEVERHRDAHSHGGPTFGCPGTAFCIERFGAETPVTEVVLDRFSITGRVPVGNGLYLSIGRVDVPFGIERHDEPLNVTATTSELFQFGRVQRMTGAQASYVFSPMFDVTGWWVNRWESETTHTPFDDNNSGKSYGGRFGITPVSTGRLVNIGIGGFAGPEQNLNDDRKRWMVDLDFVAAPSAQLFIAGEFAVGGEDEVSFRRRGLPFPQPAAVNEDVKWNSGYVLAHGDANDWLGLNFRYGYIDDNDGARTGVIQLLQSITLGPVFHLSAIDPNLGNSGAAYGRTRHPIHWLDLKVEYRVNFSDQTIFSAALPAVDITDATKNGHQVQAQFVLNF
jgi:hypothetical protein